MPVNEADDYANEVESLLFEIILQDELVPNVELTKVVSLIENVALHRRNFLGEFAAQIQEKFYAILDQLLCLCMEKLEEPTTKTRFPNCFSFLCLAQSHLVQHLQPEHQLRTLDFFRTKMIKLIPSYDVGLGLSIIDTFGKEFDLADLVNIASQPTSAVPYAAKVELTTYLLDKPVALDGLEAWLVSTLQNLMLVPELNTPPGAAWTPGSLESLLGKVLVAPGNMISLLLTSEAGKFRSELYAAFSEAFSQNIERFLARPADSSILTQRLGGVVALLSRVVAIILRHPNYEAGINRLGSSCLAQLIALYPPYADHSILESGDLLSAWSGILRSGKWEVTRAILEPLMDLISDSFHTTEDPKRSVSMAEEVSTTVGALLQADWPFDEIDRLISHVCPPSATWAKLHADLVLQHDVDLQNLALTFAEGYILSPEYKDPSNDSGNGHMLRCILNFSSTLIGSLPEKAKSCARHLAASCFLTDVLFSWVEMVISGQELSYALNLELAESAWHILEKAGLGFSFRDSPPASNELPLVLHLVYGLPDSVPGLTSLAAGLIWTNAIKNNSYNAPKAWQQWLVDAAMLEPSKCASLLKGMALMAGSIQKPDALLTFQSDLADQLISISPEVMAEAVSKNVGLSDFNSKTLFLFYCLISFELPRPKCQALNYWGIAVLKLAFRGQHDLCQSMFWGVLIPILEFTIANSYHQPSASLRVIVAQETPVWKDILDSYASVFDVIQALLKMPASPLAYLIKRNTLALLEALVGLSSGQFSDLVSWPQYQEAISKLILELMLAEYLPTDAPLEGPRFYFVSQLSSCVSLISLADLEAKAPTNQLCGLLHSKHPALARSAAKLLLMLLPSQIQSAKEQLNAQPPPRIPLPLIVLAQQDRPASSASDFGQLLAWLLVLRSCEMASYELKLVYTEQIQASGGIQSLVSLVIELLGIAEPHPFDCGAWDVTGILLDGLEATAFLAFRC
ncbi:hypothetical protein DSO57_1037199 [Entomophthora muscae]|uniref:Uncharacterized protein n=1 Tax=Entomophthora muscae TaxID=34485 RepID=A0ACC2RQ14_9FUNG|nr:hypothetical protein DSO57_1037199 [Entomophthora muscae]